jgi:hypothetical protein
MLSDAGLKVRHRFGDRTLHATGDGDTVAVAQLIPIFYTWSVRTLQKPA